VKALGPEQVLAVLPLHLEEGINAEIQVKTAQGDAYNEDVSDMDVGVGGRGFHLSTSHLNLCHLLSLKPQPVSTSRLNLSRFCHLNHTT